MTQGTLVPTRILAVLDDTEEQSALLTAAGLAGRHDAKVEAFCCVEPPHDLAVIARLSGRETEEVMRALVAAKRAAAKSRLEALLPTREVSLHVGVGKTFIEIIRHVILHRCDFVIKRAEPLSGIHGLLYASTDQHLLRKCPCPVWLQTSAQANLPKRVIAAVDVDIADAAEPETLWGLNQRVIEAARCAATGPGAEIRVLHAWDATGEGMVWAFASDSGSRVAADMYVNEVMQARHRAMDDLLGSMDNDSDGQSSPTMTPRLERGRPEQVIIDQCQAFGADLVVMGTVARTGLSGFFIGNTAENIINSLECPVLAVKPDGFVSPLDPR